MYYWTWTPWGQCPFSILSVVILVFVLILLSFLYSVAAVQYPNDFVWRAVDILKRGDCHWLEFHNGVATIPLPSTSVFLIKNDLSLSWYFQGRMHYSSKEFWSFCPAYSHCSAGGGMWLLLSGQHEAGVANLSWSSISFPFMTFMDMKALFPGGMWVFRII